MNIIILSRGPQLYSTQSLVNAAQKRKHHVQVIDHMKCDLILERNMPQIYYQGKRLHSIDAVIPRIGASVTLQGAAVIKQFEMMNVFTLAHSEALLLSRDKLKCLQNLSKANIAIPKTVFVNSTDNLEQLIRAVQGLPLIIKMVESTHGTGVIIAESANAAKSTIETFIKLKERIILQEYIAESKGADYRALVVGNKVVGAMKRQAKAGEFRSNLHRGASSEIIHLTKEEEDLALKAVQVMGLHIAGVDILRSKRGPLIMEVNASPGLEGIETTTQIDIAGDIIEFISKNYRKGQRSFANNRRKRIERNYGLKNKE